MNRNEIIDTIIDKTLGYTVQGFVYSKVVNAINPQSLILIRNGTKYGIILIKYVSNKYVRTDFKSAIIFSDAIDASFFTD